MSKISLYQPVYTNLPETEKMIGTLKKLPPLVTTLEIEFLKKQLAAAAENKCFLLQGGDCAESFEDCQTDNITNKLKILLQMSLILIHGLHKPVVRVGRLAGQYAKPRTSETETQGEVTLPSYRGDLINRAEFTEAARTPDPMLMLEGYQRAALTLNYIRALVSSGFADLMHPEYWELDFVRHSPMATEYESMVHSLNESIVFLKTISAVQQESLHRVDFFTSHEALHLQYENALTKQENGKRYNFSTHFPWIGMRTAGLDSAHIEYARDIANPIAVKIGPTMTREHLEGLLETLHPHNEPGRLTFIHRFGSKKIAEHLPPLIETVKKSGKTVLWSCDPMHGNTETTAEGIKTRRFDDVLSELQQAFEIHKQLGSHLGGVHFELTGDNVTECLGGARGLTEADLKYAYKSLCDPRLNYEQALEMAMLIVKKNGPKMTGSHIA